MTRPNRYLGRMALFVLAVAAAIALIAFAYETLQQAFMANPVLNGIIVGILLIGILFNFRQVLLRRQLQHHRPS